MNETTKNLFEAFARLESPKVVTKEFRLYYNQEGQIIRGTETLEEIFDDPFVVVDEETYRNNHRYIIKDGKAVKIEKNYVPRISDKGYRVACGHSALLLEKDETIREQYYEW
jgi:hypothetical protein